MSGFDYPWTCPIIDKALKEVRAEIYSSGVEDADALFAAVEEQFEKARASNSDMRAAAEARIAELEAEVADLEQAVTDLSDERDDLLARANSAQS